MFGLDRVQIVEGFGFNRDLERHMMSPVMYIVSDHCNSNDITNM